MIGIVCFCFYFCWFAGGAGRRQLFFLHSLAVGQVGPVDGNGRFA